ncbi:hypothetical protein HYDPIDRAFT_112380 [Hydnomerulius pinastri MD-312]|uniref:Uncharacterized protein n=1 Tax=Hydnomerulius pinastri MD-312 TaxID=994086 RepID=A0A0C9W0R3_9AGAM|nr:hypothetical protein HYDPIDRAFT_112380 [Hydnomerulius pinastri MD-312]
MTSLSGEIFFSTPEPVVMLRVMCASMWRRLLSFFCLCVSSIHIVRAHLSFYRSFKLYLRKVSSKLVTSVCAHFGTFITIFLF